jgi:hypothetical protein
MISELINIKRYYLSWNFMSYNSKEIPEVIKIKNIKKKTIKKIEDKISFIYNVTGFDKEIIKKIEKMLNIKIITKDNKVEEGKYKDYILNNVLQKDSLLKDFLINEKIFITLK